MTSAADSPATECDLLVIGGGINGAGIARDAAGRGYRVILAERDDLASHTSSASTKLIHGGLRYLEQYEFRLVAEALAEREVLLRVAGHMVWPARFIMPHVPELRPRWMIRAGLFLYDHLGGWKPARGLARRSLPGSHGVRLDEPGHERGTAAVDDVGVPRRKGDGCARDGFDPIAVDEHVSGVGEGACAVDDLDVLEHHLGHGRAPL